MGDFFSKVVSQLSGLNRFPPNMHSGLPSNNIIYSGLSWTRLCMLTQHLTNLGLDPILVGPVGYVSLSTRPPVSADEALS